MVRRYDKRCITFLSLASRALRERAVTRKRQCADGVGQAILQAILPVPRRRPLEFVHFLERLAGLSPGGQAKACHTSEHTGAS